MKVYSFVCNEFQENTYLLASNKEAVLIDPGCVNTHEKELITKTLQENNLNLKAVWLTHGHIDHVIGVPWVVETFQVPVFMHADDMFFIENANVFASYFGIDFHEKIPVSDFISHESVMQVGNSSFQVIHTFGHSPGGVVFYNTENNLMFSGDTLFKSSIGRSDLPKGSHDALVTNIQTKLLTLPEETNVYPGHGPSTTILEEKTNNPFLTP